MGTEFKPPARCMSSAAAYLHRAAAVLESEHRAREAGDAAAAAPSPPPPPPDEWMDERLDVFRSTDRVSATTLPPKPNRHGAGG